MKSRPALSGVARREAMNEPTNLDVGILLNNIRERLLPRAISVNEMSCGASVTANRIPVS